VSEPLNVLAVTSELPWPLDTGGHLRTFYLLRALAARHNVRLLTAAPMTAYVSALRDAGLQVHVVHAADRRPWREFGRIVTAAARREPYVMYRRHLWRSVAKAVLREAAASRIDALYLDHLDSFVYGDAATAPCTVGDLHNVYSLIASRSADEQRRGLTRSFLRREARLLARMEQHAAARADLIMTVSDSEADYYRALGGRVAVVPNGVDCSRYRHLPTGRCGGVPTLLYVGAMSWSPNVAAVQFLATHVWPSVRQKIPTAELRIVGRGAGPDVLALARHPGVVVTGRVDDVVPELERAHALAVPLETGGGTRLKILEAFAAGLPVISTPVGAEGIAADHGVHLQIAERATFAQSVVELLATPDIGRRLAQAARALAYDVYDWEAIGGEAVCAIEAAVERKRQSLRGEAAR
jgi:glycosyltransferase involved in cell wall biosynthesis